MKWAYFYSQCEGWSDSTIKKHIPALEDFGPSEQIAEVCYYFSTENARLLVRHAHRSGVLFAPGDIVDIAANVDDPVIDEMVRHTMKNRRAFTDEEILELQDLYEDYTFDPKGRKPGLLDYAGSVIAGNYIWEKFIKPKPRKPRDKGFF